MSWTKNNRLRCDICCRFIGWKASFYEWAPYGSCLDVDPPEDEHAHKECYEKSNSKNLIERTSWVKPYLYNKENE